jgi:hypothetical protein
MTATTAPIAPTAADVAPATPFRRRAVGVAGVVGGLLTTAGFVATNWETDTSKLAYLDSLVVDPMRSQVAALLLHYGYMGIVPVLLALAVMTRRRHRVAGNIGFGLAAVGGLALPGLLVTDFYDMAIRQSLPADQAVAVSDAAQALPLGFLLGGPFIMATFAGMTVLGLAAWRAGFFHWAPTLLIPIALVIPMVVPIGTVQGIAQGVALGGFLLAAGVAALRMTDQEWVTGARGAGR